MNPCAGATRKTMTGLLAEFSSVFDDKRVHLGGDEMSYACWSQDAAVKPGCAFETGPPPPNETTFSQLEERWNAAPLLAFARPSRRLNGLLSSALTPILVRC